VGSFETLEFQGCRLAYRIEGAGPPLVLIQGVGAHGLGWNPQVEILKQSFACLTFDNRGIGASQPAGERLTVEQMAADALALMEHAGWESAHVVGHSLGGLIAVQLTLADKPRVRSLSLLCTFARGADATRLTAALLSIMLRIRFGTRRFRRQAFLELVLPPDKVNGSADAIAERLAAVLGHDIADIPPITGRQLAAMKHHDVSRRLHELAGNPTLVISGEKDTLASPASGRALAAGIPGSRYVEIAGASHALPVLEARRCAALLLDHLREAERRIHESAPGGAAIDA
jgi:pimeloyl-ACP methyl ester carboxylesterase